MILLANRWPVCTACYGQVAASMKAVHIDAVDGARLACAVIDNYTVDGGIDIMDAADRDKLADAVARTVKAIAVAIGRAE